MAARRVSSTRVCPLCFACRYVNIAAVKATLYFERDPKVLKRLFDTLLASFRATGWSDLPSLVKIPHPYLKPTFYSFSPRNNRSHPVVTRVYRPIRMHRLVLTKAQVQRWDADSELRKQVWKTELERGYVEFELVDGD